MPAKRNAPGSWWCVFNVHSILLAIERKSISLSEDGDFSSQGLTLRGVGMKHLHKDR